MTSSPAEARPSVVIVGGGLAGLAAAVALAESNCRVQLLEARRLLGGRAGSFCDSATGELVDHCQHVSMGCCTNLADFCRRVGIANSFRRDRELHFIGPDGGHYPFAASPLPAPFHLAPAFWRLTYLTLGERLAIGRAMWKLMRLEVQDDEASPTIGAWLAQQGQSARAIEWFWGVILVSGLGEDLDRASLAAARKVIVDGFLASREGYVVEVPQVPLGTLYGDSLMQWFTNRGVTVRLGAAVRQVKSGDCPRVLLADGAEIPADYVVLAVPWHKVAEIVDEALSRQWPWLAAMQQVGASPITGVHLWFDRPIMPYDHAVLPGRLSQWIFKHERQPNEEGFYYQVVVSASRELAGRQREDVIAEVRGELAAIWPVASVAKLLHARLVTEHAAVFSVRPGLDRMRPQQQTRVPGVLVAGDWTATGWPATMEGAVRSGYLAAEGVLQAIGRPRRLLAADLPRGFWAQLLIRD